MLKITSRDNQRLKHAKKVRDGKIKDAVFVEGIRLAEETLRSDVAITEVLYELFRKHERVNLVDKISALKQIFEVQKILTRSRHEKLEGIFLCEKPAEDRNIEGIIK